VLRGCFLAGVGVRELKEEVGGERDGNKRK
jgi:hypothetical protein